VVAALGGMTFWSMGGARRAPHAAMNAPPAAVADAPPAPRLVPDAPWAMPAEGGLTLAAPPPQPLLATAPDVQPAPDAVANRLANPTLVFDAGGGAVVGPPTAPGGEPKGAGANDDFAARIGGVGGGTAIAGRTFDPATTVTQGTLIPAVLETAIDTDVPGFVRAVVSADVRGFDGGAVLVPRSSRLIGQYKSGLSAGQKRAYVIWTRLIRPDGASVDLGSPAVAFGGEAGLAGKVNTHFFERFGSAMLLSVIGGLTSVANTGASVILGGGQSAAATAVQQGGQVGPTVRVRPGEPIRVFTARDLDFSKVK